MYTAYDVIEYLLSSTGGGAQDQEHRALRQALFHGYRDLMSVRDWKWHQANDTITLTSADLVTTYRLPWGVSSIDAVYMPQLRIAAEYVNQTDWKRIEQSPYQQLVRLAWTVLPSANKEGYYELKIYNGYRYNETLTFTYRRRPRDLRLTGWEPSSRAGTVTFTSTTNPYGYGSVLTVSGSGTSFSSPMLNAVIRVSGDSSYHPEGLAGMHPYVTEAFITAVGGSSSMTAHSPETATLVSGSKYLVTDLLDISPTMYTALLSACEAWLARLMGKNSEAAMAIHARDLRLAYEADTIAPVSGRRASTGGFFSFWYLRPGVDQGT